MSAADKTAVPASTDAGKGGAYRRPVPVLRPDRSLSAYVRDPKSLNPALKQAARLTLVTARLPTSRARILPSFLIVGAQRCGTTSLSRTLDEHPAVFSAVLHEEVHFFDVSYRRGLSWYRCHFPLLAVARRTARRAGVTPVSFESSPYYMFHPLAAERIELEPARLEGQAERIAVDPDYFSYSHQHHSYIARGQYVDQLERLERHFGRDRLHVVDSGDFFTDPEAVYDGVLAFLGLPNRGYPAFKRRNARPRSPMPDSVRATLEKHYGPYDERLAAWLGHEPSWRRGR
jgi:hypothetical protein